MPSGRGVCAAVEEDVDGGLLQLGPCGGQVGAVLHPSSVQQLLPARCPGAAAVPPQRAARRPKKGAVRRQNQIKSKSCRAGADWMSASKVTRRQMRSSTLRQRRKPGGKRSVAAAAWGATAVSQLFEGRMSSVSLCMHCDQQAHSSQPFTVLSLPIPTDTSKCTIEVTVESCSHTGTVSTPEVSDDPPPPSSLSSACAVQDCLSLFFQQTILTGGEQMLCSVCGLRRETTVFTCLDNPPEILTLHLKRWVEM